MILDLIKIIKYIKSFKTRFDGLGFKELLRIVKKETNLVYNMYPRGNILKDYNKKIKEYCDKN